MIFKGISAAFMVDEACEKRIEKGTLMNNEKTIEEAKARAKSIFVAIALTIIGALLLAGGAYFWIMPVFEGGEPNLLGSSANCRKPFCPAATHPNTAGHFGKPRCRVGTPPLPGCIRRSALQPIIP